MKDGIIWKGGFCPYWGGLCYGKSKAFFNGGLRDLSVSLLANQNNNGVIEVYEESDDDPLRTRMERGG